MPIPITMSITSLDLQPVLSSALVGQTRAGLSKCYLNGTSSGNVSYVKQFPGRLMQNLR